MGNDQTERQFNTMIALMMVFFFTDMILEVGNGMKWFPEPITTAAPHDAFLTVFGIAAGLFRGMTPQGSPMTISGDGIKSTITTDIHSEKTAPADK